MPPYHSKRKENMRKLTVLLLALMMVFGFTACDNSTPSTPSGGINEDGTITVPDPTKEVDEATGTYISEQMTKLMPVIMGADMTMVAGENYVYDRDGDLIVSGWTNDGIETSYEIHQDLPGMVWLTAGTTLTTVGDGGAQPIEITSLNGKPFGSYTETEQAQVQDEFDRIGDGVLGSVAGREVYSTTNTAVISVDEVDYSLTLETSSSGSRNEYVEVYGIKFSPAFDGITEFTSYTVESGETTKTVIEIVGGAYAGIYDVTGFNPSQP